MNQKGLLIMRFTSIFKITTLSMAISTSLAAYISTIPTASHAGDHALMQAVIRIDMAGRQRMLAQRMTMLSCLVHLDIDAESNSQKALAVRDLYGETLEDLHSGNAALNVMAATTPQVLSAISDARAPFQEISDLLSTLEGNSAMSIQRLQAIANASEQVFQTAYDLTNQAQSASSVALQGLPLINSMIINISGRQRMLAEKSAKLFCLAQAGINVDQNLQELTKTESIFDNTMLALINGMPGVILPPPTAEIKTKLERVWATWKPAKDMLDSAVEGATFSADDIAFVVSELETVRVMMNEVVKLYDEATAG